MIGLCYFSFYVILVLFANFKIPSESFNCIDLCNVNKQEANLTLLGILTHFSDIFLPCSNSYVNANRFTVCECHKLSRLLAKLSVENIHKYSEISCNHKMKLLPLCAGLLPP